MAYLIYQEQAGDKLKLIAEVDTDTATEAVDALVDSDAKFGGQEFVVFPSEAKEDVEAGQPIVRSRSKSERASSGTTRRRRPAQKAEEADEAPARSRSTRKPAGRKPAAKPAATKARTRPTAKPKAKPAAAKKTTTGVKPKPRSTAKKSGGFSRSTKGDD